MRSRNISSGITCTHTMEGLKMAFLLFLFACLGTVNFIEGRCLFPESVKGRDWRGSNDYKLSFTEDGVLKQYKLKIHNLGSTDFECVKSYTDNRYLVRALKPLTIFGIKVALYMCMEIKQEDIYSNGIHVKKYAIDTKENSFLSEKVFPKWSDIKNLPTEEEVCNFESDEIAMIELNNVATREAEKQQLNMKRLLDILTRRKS